MMKKGKRGLEIEKGGQKGGKGKNSSGLRMINNKTIIQKKKKGRGAEAEIERRR